MPVARKVVVDCAAWGARAKYDEADERDAVAEKARKDGDLLAASHHAAQAVNLRVAGRNSLLAAGLPDEYPEPETWHDLTEDELAQRVLDGAEGVRQQAAQMRAQRNALLQQSDWTQMPGAPLTTTEQAEWARYRQFLRDLPEKTDQSFPSPPTKREA